MTANMLPLDEKFLALLKSRERKGRLRRLKAWPAHLVDFSSNSYLSLSNMPQTRQNYVSEIQRCDSEFSLGSGGSRLLDGNTPLTNAVEREIAEFHRGPVGLLFNSGYEANVALFAHAPQQGDVLVHDELIHASVHDGLKLSRAGTIVSFEHNCVFAPGYRLEGLDGVLRRLTRGDHGRDIREGFKNVFIAVEAVYSMDGDLAPLKDIVECIEQHLPRGNGYLIVDEAHSTGLYGDRGRGLVCQLGLEDRVWARLHTFGKAICCSGGEVLTPSQGDIDIQGSIC